MSMATTYQLMGTLRVPQECYELMSALQVEHVLKSIMESDQAHSENYIFRWVYSCIKENGERRIVQVVYDNTASSMYLKAIMKVAYPILSWNSCAIHTIDHTLKDIEKLFSIRQ